MAMLMNQLTFYSRKKLKSTAPLCEDLFFDINAYLDLIFFIYCATAHMVMLRVTALNSFCSTLSAIEWNTLVLHNQRRSVSYVGEVLFPTMELCFMFLPFSYNFVFPYLSLYIFESWPWKVCLYLSFSYSFFDRVLSGYFCPKFSF